MAPVIDWRNKDYRKNGIDDITIGLDGLKLSVLARAAVIGKSVRNVTIGPNSNISACNVYIEDENDNGVIVSTTAEKSYNSQSKNLSVLNNSSSSKNVEFPVLDESSRCLLKILDELEQNRKRSVMESIKERQLKMEEDARIRWLEFKTKYQYKQREKLAEFYREGEMILRQEQQEEILASKRQQQYAQEHRQHAQRINELNERIKEAEKIQKQAEEEERQRLKEKKMFIEKIHQHQMEFRSKYEQIAELARHCKDRQTFIAKVSSHIGKLKSLNEAMDQLVKQCKVGEVSNLDLQTASSVVQQTEVILEFVRSVNDKIVENITNEEKQKEEEKAKAAEEQKKKTEQQESAAKLSESSEGLNDFVGKESFQKYMSLQQHLQSFQTSYEALMTDDTLKQFRFNCQKAVNIPVNAISPISAAHLHDKLVKLSRLISGQTVEVGHARITASSHPHGVAFCKNLMARKFVCQGELTVSSKPEAAFAIAAVMQALWADFPDFGQLVLAHFHRECPYLVPMFLPQVEGQSNADYYKSLGYHYNENGEVEKQDRFLKRMSGIMRLYAAILITRPCKYQQNKTNPHGLSQAWHWLSCILNMDARPDICATLIYDFLEVAGNSMYTYYGQQFQKLLHLICKEYFPKIEKVTPSVSSGPMIRLEAFLQKILKQGHIPPPVGVLPPNFW